MILELRLDHKWKFEELPDDTIALDGAVDGLRIDAENRRFSFDRHSGPGQLANSATCQQVLDAMLLGLDPAGMRVLVDNIGGDAVLSFWLLQNSSLWKFADNVAAVRPLVAVVGGAAARGPGYPVWDPALGRHFERQVIEPRRGSGDAEQEEATPEQEFRERVGRLQLWWERGLVCEDPSASPFDIPVLHHFGSWVFLDAGNDDFRLEWLRWICELGHDRAVLARRRPDGLYDYKVYRRSEFVDGFSVREIVRVLDWVECAERDAPAFEGGYWHSDGVSGRSNLWEGSLLKPQQVIQAVKAFLLNSAIRDFESVIS